MNEEINKIIELLKCKEDSYCCLHYKECELLLDYITNLQQKVEQLEKENKRLNNIIKDLLKDIEVIVECEDINIIKMQLRNCLYKLNKLKENK